MTTPLTDRLVGVMTTLDQTRENPETIAEVRELLIDVRNLLIDLDHSRRHFQRAARIAAAECARLAEKCGGG